jgi:hypothetical protein
MSIRYEPETNCYVLRDDRGQEAGWPAERIAEVGDLPVHALDVAYRRPGEWIDLAQPEALA